MVHIAHKHLNPEVEIATGVKALGHFLHLLHSIHKFAGIFLAVLLESNVTKHKHSVSYHVGVDHSHIFFNIALAFEAFLALECGRSRKVNSFCKLFCGEFCVLLKHLQNLNVNSVKFLYHKCSNFHCFCSMIFC